MIIRETKSDNAQNLWYCKDYHFVGKNKRKCFDPENPKICLNRCYNKPNESDTDVGKNCYQQLWEEAGCGGKVSYNAWHKGKNKGQLRNDSKAWFNKKGKEKCNGNFICAGVVDGNQNNIGKQCFENIINNFATMKKLKNIIIITINYQNLKKIKLTMILYLMLIVSMPKVIKQILVKNVINNY